MMPHLMKFLATFFYIGYVPVAPGTTASLMAVGLFLLLKPHTLIYVFVFLLVLAIGFGVSGSMEKLSGSKDASCIVIDEVAGCLVAFFLLPDKGPILVTAFFLFRAFDMFKIYPVNKLESLQGSAGIMLDDLVAGVYTNVTMHISMRLAGMG